MSFDRIALLAAVEGQGGGLESLIAEVICLAIAVLGLAGL